MESISWPIYGVLSLAGFIAGFVDSIAGGGGLIALPVLLSAGIPPHMALGTNKLQGSFGTFTATLNYLRNGLIDFKSVRWGVFYTALGAGLGTVAIQFMSDGVLRLCIPLILLAVFIYLLFSPKLGAVDRKALFAPHPFYLTAGLLLGFYDGFLGPGTGSFWMLGFVVFLGINMQKATAHTKVMNFTSNVVSLALFLKSGLVLIPVGLTMGFWQIAGAFVGSNLVVLKGVRLVRIFLLAVIALTIAKLVYSTYRF